MASDRVVKPLLFPSSMITQPDEVYPQTMDENEVLSRLIDKTNPAVRAVVIEDLRASVRRNGGRLIFEDRHGLFHVFQSSLCDSDPNFRLRCIKFISEIIPEFGTDLDNCMTLILPQLVSNLGNHAVTVKKSAIQTLHVYMKNSTNVGAVFNAIIEHGLESEDKRTRTESLVALPILITPNLAHEDLFVLTKALVGILEGSSRPEPTVLSLDRIRNVVGEEKFNDYLRRLPSNQQKICLEAIQNWGRFYREDVEINLRKAKSASHLDTNGVLGTSEEHLNGEKHHFDRGHTIAVTKGYSGRENIRFNNDELAYGFVPHSVIAKLRDQSNWRVRAQGIEELKTVMGYLGDTTPVLPHLASLFGLLLDFLDDINFKITVTSLQIIGLLISKLGQNAKPFLKPLVNTLTNKLGDNKIVIRQENMKVLMQLMQILSPKPVLNVLTASLQHPKSKVREETLNVVIGALLTFPRSDFDLPELTNAIAPALTDNKRKVRQAALEAFAVIAQAMGPGHLSPIVSAVDKVELTRGGDGVMAAVQARLARRQLPRLNSDGLVEYAIPVPSSGTVRGQSSPRGADIEWVMAGTGGSSSADVTNSVRSTPGLNDSMNNSGPSPRRYYSAGRNRLPWEDIKDSVSNQNEVSEQKPQLVRNSWVPTEIVNDRSPKRSSSQRQGASINKTPSSAPTSTSKLTSTSYTEKYLRNLHQTHQTTPEAHMPKPPDSNSSSSSSYAEIYRNKVKKEKTKGNLNVSTNVAALASSAASSGAGGSYALLYKRGTIHTKAKASSSAEPALGEGQSKESTMRSAHSATPTALPGSSVFMPADDELFFSQRKNFTNSLSNSWPDWTESYSTGRPCGRLSPVAHAPVADLDGTFDDSDSKRSEPHTPVHIKPQLARSASKIRGLKTQDLNDGIPGIDPLENSLNRTVPLAPVTSSGYGTPQDPSQLSKDSLKQVHDQVSKRTHKMYPVSGAESEDSAIYMYSPQDSSNGSIRSADEESFSQGEMSPVKASPFSGKPRMATPVHSRRIHSGHGSTVPLQSPMSRVAMDTDILDVKGQKIVSKDIGGKHSALISHETGFETPTSTSGVGSSISSADEVNGMRDVSVVGQGILNLEKTRADSIDGKDGATKTRNGKLEYEPEEDEEEDEEEEDEEDEDEDEDEEDEEGEEDEEDENAEDEEDDDDSGTVKADSNGKENSDDEDKIKKDNDIIADEVEDIEDSSDSDSDTEEKKSNENTMERDMTPRTMRKSLSKSTRERMERKKQLEEERLLKEQQRVESLERERMKLAQSKRDEEEHLRKKIKKEQQELERMLQKKEKEREVEKQKQKLLQEQLLQQERALTERLQKQQEELEEIEKEKQREREKEKEKFKERMRQKQLKLQKEKEEAQEKERQKEKEEKAEKLRLQIKKENELKRKLELEESEKRKRQQQAAQDMKETLEDKDQALSITGSSTPLKYPLGRTPKKKMPVSSAQSDRDDSYATTDDPQDSRRHISATYSSSAAIWEVKLEDLKPFPNADNAVKDALKYLANTEDWELKCEGLQHIRRLSKNHPDTLALQLHAVTLAVIAEVKNLRSQVSRAALCCLGDMFVCFGRQMDTDLEVCCKILLNKSGETSGFIRDDADKALSSMVYNVTATRALVAITSNGCGHRSAAVRKTAASFLSVVAERIGANRLMSGAKDVTDRILPAAAQFATDGGPETRYYGRKILYIIYEHPEFEKLLTKHVAANHRQVRDIVDNLKTKGLGDPPSDHTSARQRKNPTGSGINSRNGSGGSSKSSTRSSYDPSLQGSAVNSPVTSRESSRSGKSATRETLVNGEELIPEVVTLLSANDWKERLQGLDLFVELADRNPQGMGPKFTKAFDSFIPRLTDSNSKVNLYALQCLPRIIPSLAIQSGALVPPIVAALTSNLASKNTSIFTTADEALTVLVKHIDNICLVQPFCTTSQYGNSRVKPVILDKLCLVIEGVYSRKPQVIQRYVVPLIWHLLGSASTGSAGSGTSDIKNATIRLTNLVYSCMGRALLDQSSTQVPRIRERLLDITGAES